MGVLDAAAYCTDEDVLTEATSDFPLLVPRDIWMAAGSDGAMSAGSWVLSSATNDFGAQGVAAGLVCILAGLPRGGQLVPVSPAAQAFGSSPSFSLKGGTSFIVDVPATTLTLRRLGKGSGIGLPPSMGATVSGINFVVPDMAAFIKAATDRVRQDVGQSLDDGAVTASDLKTAAVYSILKARYFAVAYAEPTLKDDFLYKGKEYTSRYKELIQRIRNPMRQDFEGGMQGGSSVGRPTPGFRTWPLYPPYPYC